MRKTFSVTGSKGDIYKVVFTEKNDKLQAKCGCDAGAFGTMCKHILGVIADNEDIYALLVQHEMASIYDEFVQKQAEAERLKNEAAKAKKLLAKTLLTRKI